MEAKLLLGFCIAGSISLPAWRFHALDGLGALAALAMGTIVFGLGGMMPSVALVLFFVSGSLLSSLPGRRSMPTGDESHGRSWKQVVANGAIPTVLIASNSIFPQYRQFLLVTAVAAIAAAAADSWSTEIGTRYGGKTRDILTARLVAPGISGGVSARGLLAAFAGALVVASSTYYSEPGYRVQVSIAVTIAAFAGAIADSIIGSSLQGRFRCGDCNEITELRAHCGRPAMLVKGKSWINNNVVNFVATAIGAIICCVELDFGL